MIFLYYLAIKKDALTTESSFIEAATTTAMPKRMRTSSEMFKREIQMKQNAQMNQFNSNQLDEN